MNIKTATFIFLSLFMVNCNSKAKEDLVGEWKLEEVDIEKAISNFEGEQKDFARMMMTSAFDNVKGKMKMTFFENRKYFIETPVLEGNIKKDTGTWSFVFARKKLKLKNADGIEKHRILKLNKDLLIIEMEQAGFGTMVMSFRH